MSAVAIRWLLHRPCVSSVVIGPRTVEQLEENLQAATLQLTPEEVKELSDASRVQTPYPASFTRSQNHPQRMTERGPLRHCTRVIDVDPRDSV